MIFYLKKNNIKFTSFPLIINVFVLILLSSSCNKENIFEDVSGFEDDLNYNLVIVSGDNQIGLQNTALDNDIVIRVEDALGNTLPNISLNVKVVSGGGKANETLVVSNADGVSSFKWELGKGYFNELQVSSGLSPVITIRANALYKYEIPISENDGWVVSSIEESTNNPSKIYEGIDEIRKNNYKQIHSVVLAVNDNLVFEEYFSGTNSFGEFIKYDKNTAHELQSVNKSFRSAMIGIAIDKGYIASDQLEISTFFPNLDYLKKDGKEVILLEHFLNMSSGFEWNEGTDLPSFYGTPFETAHTYVLSKPLESTPGTVFEYNTGTSFILNKIIINSIDVGFETFAKTNYSDLVESTALPGTGEPLDFRNTPRDMLKLGQVYLNDGKWKNTQVISKSWVDKSIEPHFVISDISSYGYQWWIRDFVIANKTYNCFYAVGFGGQYIFVIKDLNLVATFTAGNFNSDMNKPIEIMEQYILPAFD